VGVQSSGKKVLLTPREAEVAQLLCDGLTVREIAESMGITYNTVKKYLAELFWGLGITERVQLVAWCWQHPEAVLAREWTTTEIQRFGCRPAINLPQPDHRAA
jgi:DNA-binding CsgD family transcriptional regulator